MYRFMDKGKAIPLAFIAFYLGLVLLVGVWTGRRKQSSASWQFGAGGLSVFGIISMLLGTRLGAASTIGLVEDVHETGMVAFAFVLGGVLGSIICGFTTGRYFYRTKTMTTAAFNFQRLGKRVTFFGIFLDITIGLAVNALQVLGVGLIIRGLTGLDLVWGIAIGSFLGWIYLTLGGITATAATNIIHLGVCFLGILGATVILFSIMPLAEVTSQVPAEMMDPFSSWATIARWMIVGIAISISVNIYHSPLATARTERAAIAASFWTGIIFMAFGALVIIMGLYAIAWAGPIYEASQGKPLSGADAFGVLSSLIGNEAVGGSKIGGFVGLVMMSGVIGAIISTMAPLAWGISTILSRDVYKGIIKPDATSGEELVVARIFSTIYWLVPGVIALQVERDILGNLLFLLELPVGGALAAFLCYYWDRVNEQSAFYTLVASFTTGVIHKAIEMVNPEFIHSLGPWFSTPLSWIIIVSPIVFFGFVFFGKPPSKEELEVVRRARANLEPLSAEKEAEAAS